MNGCYIMPATAAGGSLLAPDRSHIPTSPKGATAADSATTVLPGVYSATVWRRTAYFAVEQGS